MDQSQVKIPTSNIEYQPSRHIQRIINFLSIKMVEKEIIEETFHFLKEIESKGCDVVMNNDLFRSNCFVLNKEDNFGQIFISTKDWDGDIFAHEMIFILLHEWGHFEQFLKKQKFITRLDNENDAWKFADGVISSSKYLKKYQSEYEMFKNICLDHYKEDSAINMVKAIESLIVAIPTGIVLYFAAKGIGVDGRFSLPFVLCIAILRGYFYYELSFRQSWLVRVLMLPLYSLKIVPKPRPPYFRTKKEKPFYSK